MLDFMQKPTYQSSQCSLQVRYTRSENFFKYYATTKSFCIFNNLKLLSYCYEMALKTC